MADDAPKIHKPPLALVERLTKPNSTAMLKLLDETRKDIEDGKVTTLAIAAGHRTGESSSAVSFNSEGNMGVLIGAIVRCMFEAIELQPTKRVEP